MDKQKRCRSPLAEAELAVLEEGREWMRLRLEKRLQQEADERGGFSPLERSAFGAPARDDD